MNDRLASLLTHFNLSARVFHTGELDRSVTYDAEGSQGHLHVLREGNLKIKTPGHRDRHLAAPSLLFYINPVNHSLVPAGKKAPELVCGTIDFGAVSANPLARTLAEPVIVPLDRNQELQQVLDLLFAEAFEEHCGRQAVLNRLCEVVIIRLLRHLMDRGEINIGLLAGLADPRLARALTSIHDKPEHPWTLDNLSVIAGMSRSRFAVKFKKTLGLTPGDYLASWRLGLAQTMLRKGKPLSLVAEAIGYSGTAALARAFKTRSGLSPKAWLKSSQQGTMGSEE